MKTPDVSIIICTCNRATSLRHTIEALAAVDVPQLLPTELVIVDNGSHDDTAKISKSITLPNMAVRYVAEPRPGQCYARNTGLAAAEGQIILFTDDDVRPPRDWIAAMCAPISKGIADAVTGGVRLAPHLQQEWLEPLHRTWLACTEEISPKDPTRMVGANMAFSKSVLAQVPGFDPELGPGALGYYDETLFSWQLQQAGFSLASALDTAVEHHCDATRLSRASFMAAARNMGRAHAYVTYHWEHREVSSPQRQMARALMRLSYWRARKKQRMADRIPVWEMQLLRDVHFYRQFLQERKRSRLYLQFGLTKVGPQG